MAAIALRAGHKMPVWFARGGGAIMAGGAATGNFAVVKAYRAPIRGYVTGITGVGRLNMVSCLPCRRAAIMARYTIPRNRSVIKAHIAPTGGYVAIITGIGRRYMVSRLARGGGAIMAG
jgi:hypothetical protein